MTTVACDGSSISSDSLVTSGDTVVGWHQKKVWRMSDGSIVGCAGPVDPINKFIEWLESDDDSAPPRDKDLAAIILYPNGKAKLYQGTGIVVDCELPAAIGSGYVSALTAMDLGYDAATAVKMAIKRDTMSGGRVQTMRL